MEISAMKNAETQPSKTQHKNFDSDYFFSFSSGNYDLNIFFQEDIAKLLRYESSLLPAGQTTSFSNYHKNMKEDQKKIYYLTSPR